jgi:steroid delta-isomerase-like uncharacterized protein
MAQQAVLTLVDVAKAPVLSFNDKNFDKLRTQMAQGVVYDEVATGRTLRGVNDVLNAFQGWATALPDSKATFNNEFVSGNTVFLELTWTGTHTGALQTPNGQIPPTGKRINVRACQVVEVNGDKVMSTRHYFDMATLLKQLGVTLGK